MFQSFSVNIPTIPEKEFDLRAYGAIGDGRTSNTDAFRKAIEAAAEEGGKVIERRDIVRQESGGISPGRD